MVFWEGKSQDRVIFLNTQTIMVTFVLSSEPAGKFSRFTNRSLLVLARKSHVSFQFAQSHQDLIDAGSVSDVYGSTCSQCDASVEDHFNFCVTCGARVTRHTPTDPVVPSQSTADTSTVPSNEKRLIENYFYGGYEYDVIVHLLGKFHGISISLSTLKRRMKILSKIFSTSK